MIGRDSLAVAELRANEGLNWDIDKLNLLLSNEEVGAMIRIPCLRFDSKDS